MTESPLVVGAVPSDPTDPTDPAALPAPAGERVADPGDRATGIGSFPGTDRREATVTVVGELPGMPHVVELPARGVGADVLGRTAAMLVDIAVEVRPSGYRVTSRPGAQHRRGVELLARDVDALDEALDEAGATPPRVKTQIAGPWTLTAGIELRNGHRLLTDPGAVADVTASLAEGLRAHIAELTRRTGAGVVVQIDEPTLPAVLAGALPTASGYGTVRSVPGAEARGALADLVAAVRDMGAEVVLHCCHPTPPLPLLGSLSFDGVAVDLAVLSTATSVQDALGEIWDAPGELWLGLVPGTDPVGAPPALEALARPALDLVDRLGFDRALLAERTVVTPACGLAGASPTWARAALARSVELARAFADPPTSWA